MISTRIDPLYHDTDPYRKEGGRAFMHASHLTLGPGSAGLEITQERNNQYWIGSSQLPELLTTASFHFRDEMGVSTLSIARNASCLLA